MSTSKMLLVLMLFLQLILPVAIYADASEDDAMEPETEEVQSEDNIESPMTLMETDGDDTDGSETEETTPVTPEIPDEAEEAPPADDVVTEPVDEPEPEANSPPPAPVETPEAPEAPEPAPEAKEPMVEEKKEAKQSLDAINPLNTQSNVGILAGPSSFTSDPNYPSVELAGVSINSHTRPHLMWRGNDNQIYFAVKSTHKLYYMEVLGVQVNPTYEYGSQVSIVVDGVQYQPTGLQGNTNDSHWTIFVFPSTIFSESGTYDIFVKGIGGGHDVKDVRYTVVIPKVTATLNKTWNKGPGSTVEIGLYTSIDGENWLQNPVATTTLTPIDQQDGTFFATFTWNSLDYTDSAGRRLLYEARETDPGTNYTSTMTTTFNPDTDHYIFTLINTYNIPAKDFTVIKEWNGGPAADHVEVAIYLYRKTADMAEPDLVEIAPTNVIPDSSGYPSVTTYTYTWTGLPQETDAGVPYTYYYTEEDVDTNRYDRTYSTSTTIGSNLYGTFDNFEGNVTNKYLIPKEDVTAKKHWKNGEAVRPDLWFQLWRETSTGTHEVVPGLNPIKLDAPAATPDAKVSTTFLNIKQTDFDGNPYKFYVKEGTVVGNEFIEGVPENFEMSASDNGLELTNTFQIQEEDIITSKEWRGGEEVRPELWYQLRRKATIDGIEIDEAISVEKVPASNKVQNETKEVLFESIDFTDSKGNEYEFYVVEGIYDEATDTFTPGTPANFVQSGEGLHLINTYSIPTDGTASATKVWQGATSSDFLAVPLTLWRSTDGSVFEEVEVTPTIDPTDDGEVSYEYAWAGLEETDAQGNMYTFYFSEDIVPGGYERTYQGTTITGTNKETEETITVVESGGSVTNSELFIDFTFEKVNEVGLPLEGAVFELHRHGEGNARELVGRLGENPVTSTFTFEDLTKGTYTLTEVSAPDEYILPENNTWTFEVKWDDELERLVIEFVDDISFDDESGYEIANYPKGRLPETGGPGYGQTMMLSMFAFTLLVTLGAWRMKRDEVNQND